MNNQQQTEKIKGLIKVSRILIESERAEWLSLLELMNDKQLGELEKILNSGQQSADSNQQRSVSGIERIVGDKLPESIKPKPASQNTPFPPVKAHLPQLSHIMNLPKNMDGQMSALKLSQKTMGTQANTPVNKEPVFPVGVSSKTVKAKQSFGDKLKAMFAEKELPAGIPKNELSLPAHTESSKPATLLQKPTVSFPLKEKPTTITASQVIINGPVNFTQRDEALGGGMIISPEFSKSKSGVVTPIKLSPADLPGILEKQISSLPKVGAPLRSVMATKPEDSHKLGLNIQEVSEKTRQDTLSAIKQQMSQASEIAKADHLRALNEKPIEFHWPKDLAELSATNFSKYALENYVNAIKHLVEKFGYYDVIFSLEKSPLYEIYINTGTELMSKQQTFETFDSSQTINKFLSRDDFEKFTDLLRQIASS